MVQEGTAGTRILPCMGRGMEGLEDRPSPVGGRGRRALGCLRGARPQLRHPVWGLGVVAGVPGREPDEVRAHGENPASAP